MQVFIIVINNNVSAFKTDCLKQYINDDAKITGIHNEFTENAE